MTRPIDRVHGPADLGPLGLVHGDVGPLHERHDVLAVLGVEGDADADAGVERQPVHQDGLLQAGQVRPAIWLAVARSCAGQTDPKLVAAEPGDGVRLPHRPQQVGTACCRIISP